MQDRVSCVVGIDPGSSFLGLCTLWFDSKTLEIVLVQAKTLYGAKYKQNLTINDTFGGTQSMLIGHQRYLTGHFDMVRPLAVFSESPFYNSRMPSAFGSLMKTMEHIKAACMAHDAYMHFATVDPPTAKKAIGVGGGSKDKADMLKGLDNQSWRKLVVFEEVTEHAVDSIAVAYWGYKNTILSSGV